MAKDDDELIRKFRQLTRQPPWPMGVTITAQMYEVCDRLLQHRDARGTDEYAAMRDWLAEQMRLSSDTLAPLGTSLLAPQNNPSPSAPATSPLTERLAEPPVEPPVESAEPASAPVPEPELDEPKRRPPQTPQRQVLDAILVELYGPEGPGSAGTEIVRARVHGAWEAECRAQGIDPIKQAPPPSWDMVNNRLGRRKSR